MKIEIISTMLLLQRVFYFKTEREHAGTVSFALVRKIKNNIVSFYVCHEETTATFCGYRLNAVYLSPL